MIMNDNESSELERAEAVEMGQREAPLEEDAPMQVVDFPRIRHARVFEQPAVFQSWRSNRCPQCGVKWWVGTSLEFDRPKI